jgi:hypothetical protein
MSLLFSRQAFTFVCAVLIVITLTVSVQAATTTDMPAPASTPKPVSVSAKTSHLANSHLHGAPAASNSTPVAKSLPTGTAKTAAVKKAETKPGGVVGAAAKRTARWSFTDWAELHRGLGTIRGEVHGPSGAAMAGVRVELRNSKGKVMRASMRHVTHTNASGGFVMKHVRIGSYRVRGTKGKASGHVGVKVRHGEMSSATFKV